MPQLFLLTIMPWVLDLIQFCFVLLGVFDIRSLRAQLPSAHSPTWCFLWVTMETLGLVRKRWEAAADSNLCWRDTSFLLWCQISTRYLFKSYALVKKQPFRLMCQMRQFFVHFRAAFNVGFPEYLTGNTMQWHPVCRCAASSCSPSTASPWTSGWASGLLLFSEIFLSRSSIQPENIAFYKMRSCMVWLVCLGEKSRCHWQFLKTSDYDIDESDMDGSQGVTLDVICNCCYIFKLITNFVVGYPWFLT